MYIYIHMYYIVISITSMLYIYTYIRKRAGGSWYAHSLVNLARKSAWALTEEDRGHGSEDDISLDYMYIIISI